MRIPPSNKKDEAKDTNVYHLDDFWAKTVDQEGNIGASVLSHANAAAAVAKFWLKSKSSDFAENFSALIASVPFLCAAHDVGKISPDFQRKSAIWSKNFPIENYNNLWLPYCGNHCEYSREAIFRRTGQHDLSNAAYAHHGKFVVPSKLYKNPSAWAEYRDKFLEWAEENFGKPQDFSGNHSAWILAAGIITICDWIASDEEYFSPKIEYDIESAEKTVVKLLCGKDPKIPFGAKVAKRDCEEIFPFRLNDLQKAAIDICKGRGCYLIEAEPGSGKTEAALLMAYKLIFEGHASGLYFALPTRLTSNMICGRLQQFIDLVSVGNFNAKLIHSSSWLENPMSLCDSCGNKDYEEKTEWFNSSRRALVYPFGAGTIDQILMSVLPVKHFFLRNAALSDKVIILDEIHSYDAYTGGLIYKLVERLSELGSTVIILSATLSKKRRLKFAPKCKMAKFPFIGAIYNDKSENIINLPMPNSKAYKIIKSNFKDALSNAIKKAESGLCVLFICNSVGDCQRVYEEIKRIKIEGEYSFEIGILHSKFPKFLRDKIEGKWVSALGKDRDKRPSSGCIFVSTQIVEQSVDIDADIIFTQICPIDMLIQRAGRCFRHSAPRADAAKEPEVRVIIPDLSGVDWNADDAANVKNARKVFGASGSVYHPYILIKSLKLIEQVDSLKIPHDIERSLAAVYDDCDQNSRLEEILLSDMKNEQAKLSEKAESATNRMDMPLDDESTNTRIFGVETRECLLCRKESDNEIELLSHHKIDLTRKNIGKTYKTNARILAQNVVSLPLWVIKKIRGGENESEKRFQSYFNKNNLEVLFMGLDNASVYSGVTYLEFSDELGVSIRHKKAIEGNSVISEFEKFCEGVE